MSRLLTPSWVDHIFPVINSLGHVNFQPGERNVQLKGKTIGILVGPGYEDLEFWVPYMRVKEEGAQVKLIGAKGGKSFVSKSGGLTAVSDVAAGDIAADQLAALLVPGGWAPDKLRRDPKVLQLVRDMNRQGKILGFICHAGWVAASAGICKGKRATGSTGIKDDLENAGAVWVDEPAFRDGNIIWGRVVADIPDFCRELIRALQ